MNGGFDMGPSQFAGGGFVASPAPGGDAGYGGGASAQKSDRPLAQTMRNVTVRRLLNETANAVDDNLKIDGADLTTFVIIGRIVSKMETTDELKLKVDDGTGAIDIVHYYEHDNELMNAAMLEWKENTYIRACGTLATRAMNKRCMVAFRIKLVKSFDEVTYHTLQCVFQHLHLTKGVAPPASAPQPAFGGGPGAPAAAATGGFGALAGDAPKHHADVLAIYNDGTAGEFGLHLDDVHNRLTQRGVQLTRAQLVASVEFLVNDGHLYSTNDENHHKSTSC